MGEKIQISLWLDKDLKEAVRNANLNVTKFVNEALRRYFSVSNIEEIDQKIENLRREISALEVRKAKLLSEGEAKDIKEKTWEDLKNAYKKRRDFGIPSDYDKLWLEAPINLAKAKIIDKDVDVVVQKLRDWYNSQI